MKQLGSDEPFTCDNKYCPNRLDGEECLISFRPEQSKFYCSNECYLEVLDKHGH